MIKAITQNWSVKLLSLFLALILWFFVTGEQTSEIGFSVPLELKNIPKGLMVVNDVPSVVDVRVSGPRTILSNLRPSDFSLTVDLKGAHAGVTSFGRLENRIQVPSALKISRLSPSILDVRLEVIAEATVPVRVPMNGTPPKGYRLSGVEVNPNMVTIQGARNEIKTVREVVTEPINLDGVMESFSVRAQINLVGNHTSLKDVRDVAVRVALEKLPEPEPVEPEKSEKSEKSIGSQR
ncbi:MAG: YbbR-like domain-containing protein [Desulfuromonadaceae bacterium]|nr:YbbR-like domain-containing protein [Desulfuromonadaceae bacterium]